MNIILIGLNAVGKSKIGLELSKRLDMVYFDEDDFFESQYGLIHEARKKYGEEEYQRMFLKVRTFFTNVKHTVISAGGTTGTLEIVKEYNGLIIHLNPSIDHILKRYKKKKKDFSNKNLRRTLVWEDEETIKKEYKRKNKLFEKNRDLNIDSSWLDKDEIVDIIIEELKSSIISKQLF